MKRFVTFMISVGVCIMVLVQISGVNQMSQVQFDIGKNISEAAKESGARGYSAQNIDGLLMYDFNLSPDVPCDTPGLAMRSLLRQYFH